MKQTYEIKGMHCQSCVAKVTAALKEHVDTVNVTLHPPRAVLETNDALDVGILNTAVGSVGKYTLEPVNEMVPDTLEVPAKGWLRTYYPLFLIIVMISAVSLRAEDLQGWMLNFMAGFFLVFGAFKLLDVRGFANAYATYDLLAKRCQEYGLIYPFIELSLGFAFLFRYALHTTLWASIIVMSFSSLGVIVALRKKQQIRCACLGTALNLPMSTITLVEDLGMVGMSLAMLALAA